MGSNRVRLGLLGAALIAACNGDPPTAAGTDGDTGGDGAPTDDDSEGGGDSGGDGGPALPARPDSQSCRFDGWAPGLLPPVELDISFESTVAGASTLAIDLNLGRVWVGTETGRLLVFPIDDPAATATEAIALAQTSALTGLAVDGPGRRVFVRFEESTAATVVDRYEFDDSGVLNPDSRIRVVRVPHPAGARMGSGLALDGGETLVIPFGDGEDGQEGGPADDRNDRRGSVFRLDVSELVADFGTGVPMDNPWADEPSPADQTWAIGLRDPSGCALDPQTAALWCTDVSPSTSEVTRTQSGDDLGWPTAAGPECLRVTGGCSQVDIVPPDGSYLHGIEGCGAVGGAVVRDGDLLDGVVLFGDRCSGEIWAADDTRSAIVGRWEEPPRAFAGAADGSAWAVDAAGRIGRVRVVPTEGEFPRALSDAGCFEDLAAVVGMPDLVPYELNAPLWTDGAIKRRHIALPVGEKIGVGEGVDLTYPVGTVIFKTFSFEFTAGDPESERPVETRVMILREFGWEFHGYQWNEAGTEANLLEAGLHVTLALQPEPLEYDFPSRAECGYCHGASTAARILGPRLDQLAREVDYGHTVADQLSAFESIGLFDQPLPEIAPMAAPAGGEGSAESRARAYLHTNCGHCHRPGGWAPPGLTMDLRWDATTPDTELCGVPTAYYMPWFSSEYRVVAGDPDASAIWQRISTRGPGQMPPLATFTTDGAAFVVRDWIAGLTDCSP